MHPSTNKNENKIVLINPIPHELWDDVVTRAGANLTPA